MSEEARGERCERKVRAGSRGAREVSGPALRGRNASKGPRIMTSRTAHVAIRRAEHENELFAATRGPWMPSGLFSAFHAGPRGGIRARTLAGNYGEQFHEC